MKWMPKWMVSTLAVLIGILPAFASVTVDGTAWTPGMSVTATTVGINGVSGTISGTGLASVADTYTNLWPTATISNTCYITCTEGTQLNLNVEAAPFGGAPAAGDRATVSFWLRARLTTPASLVDFSIGGIFAQNPTINSKSLATLLQVRKDLNGQVAYASGLMVQHYNLTDATGLGLQESGYCARGDGVAAQVQTRPNFPFGQWVYVTLHRRAGTMATNTSNSSLLLNGQIVARVNIDMGTTAAQLNTFSISLPALAGVTWDLGGMKSETGVPSVFTDSFRAPSNHTRALKWPMTFTTIGTTPVTASDGYNWAAAFSVGASYTAGMRPYSQSLLGGPPQDRFVSRLISGTVIIDSTRKIGTLPYNADGWCWVWWHDLYVGSGGATQLALYDTNNSATVRYLYINSSGQVFDDNLATETPLFILPTNGIYSIGYCFNSDGMRVHMAVFDKTNHHAGTKNFRQRIVFNGPCKSWTPQAIGKARINIVASPTNKFVEFGSLSVDPVLGVAMCDSYTESHFANHSWLYFTYTGSTGTLPVVGDSIIDNNSPNTTGQFVVKAIDTTNKIVLAWNADTWVQGPSNIGNTYHNGSTVGTLTGCSAALNPIWIGTVGGYSVGAAAVGDLYTEAVSLATARLITHSSIDTTGTVPTNMAALIPVSGTLTGGAAMVGASGTFTGDVPIQGVVHSNLMNGTSTSVYNCGQDCMAASFSAPYDPGVGNGFAIYLTAAAGRAGHTMEEAHQGATLQGIPATLVYMPGGLANTMFAATTPALADSLAAKFVRGQVAEAAAVVSNDGWAYIEQQCFGTAGNFTATYARRVQDNAYPAVITALGKVNERGRIYFIPDMGFPDTAGDTHYNAQGAATQANRLMLYKKSLSNASGDRSGR